MLYFCAGSIPVDGRNALNQEECFQDSYGGTLLPYIEIRCSAEKSNELMSTAVWQDWNGVAVAAVKYVSVALIYSSKDYGCVAKRSITGSKQGHSVFQGIMNKTE